MKSNKQKLNIIVLTITLIIVAYTAGYNYHTNTVEAQRQEHVKQDDVKKEIAKINKTYKNDDKLTTDERIDRIKNLSKDKSAYRSKMNAYDEVISFYNHKIKSLRAPIIKENKKVYSKLNLKTKEIKKLDISQVEESKKSLTDLISTVKSQKTVVYEGDTKAFIKKITKLEKKYQARLDDLKVDDTNDYYSDYAGTETTNTEASSSNDSSYTGSYSNGGGYGYSNGASNNSNSGSGGGSNTYNPGDNSGTGNGTDSGSNNGENNDTGSGDDTGSTPGDDGSDNPGEDNGVVPI
ncbi:hypothetical protein RD055328_13090 [Companilactobacillus sp. RD055328]|uniref:hypothetical protein n=1 Tax=Companilactobacillus sp. RD055328 TaxID=2916634 RepID=UPI001FC7BC07|nr:hypothetical protein [Companilactobacillus sp. RD055328]GKQ43386.1 hypothetical protein RD055328_13090 [Companilactobacillus sp. RD055328]